MAGMSAEAAARMKILCVNSVTGTDPFRTLEDLL